MQNCPALPPDVNEPCAQECASDLDCDGQLICCPYGCVAACVSKEPDLATLQVSVAQNAVFDREQAAALLVTLRVTDRGQPSRAQTLVVSIILSDVNDNAPVFAEDPIMFSLRENLPVGTLVGRLQATDADHDPENRAITYTVRPQAAAAQFVLNGTTGELRTAVVFDREALAATSTTLRLDCVAADQGQPDPLATNVTVLVHVTGDNDHDPVFNQSAGYTAQVPENSAQGTVVLIAEAADLDLGPNAEIAFRLDGPATLPFDVVTVPDPQRGVYLARLRVAGALDRETTDSYTVTLVAQDQGTPARSASTTLSIAVTDVNDQAPQFVPATAVLSVSEDQALGVPLATFTAQDRDLGANAVVTYSIAAVVPALFGNSGAPFALVNGNQLALSAPLDREAEAEFVVTLQATDAAQLFGQLTITVTVTDVNDNSPTLTVPSFPGPFTFTEAAGAPLALAGAGVSADDLDVAFPLTGATVRLVNSQGDLARLFGRCTAAPATVLAGCGATLAPFDLLTALTPRNDLRRDSTGALVLDGNPAHGYGQVRSQDQWPLLNATADAGLTLAAWIRQVPGTSGYVLAKSNPSGRLRFYDLFVNGSVVIFHYKRPGATGSSSVVTVTFELAATLADNTWHAVAVVIDFASMNIWLHVDGQRLDPTAVVALDDSGTPLPAHGNPLRESLDDQTSNALFVGARSESGSPADGFTGRLANVWLLRQPLDRNQVWCLVQCGPALAVFPSGAVRVASSQGGRVLELSGPATPAQYSDILASLRFHPRADEPAATFADALAPLALEISVHDGTFASNTVAVPLAIQFINEHPPDLDLAAADGPVLRNFATTFVEEGSPVRITGTVALDDADVPNPAAAVRATALLQKTSVQSGGFLRTTASSPELQSIFDAATSTLTVTGNSTLAELARVLSSLEYGNPDDELPGPSVTVVVGVNDGFSFGNFASTVITLAPVNDPPTFNPGLQQAVFFEDQQPKQLLPVSAAVTDDDGTQLSSATVVLTTAADGSAPPDSLSEGLLIDAAGLVILASATAITADYNPATATLTLQGLDSHANYLTALRLVRYFNNVTGDPSVAPRALTFTVTDDQQALSAPVTVTLQLTPADDRPRVFAGGSGADNASVVFVENSQVALLPAVVVLDADSTDLHGATISVNVFDAAQERLTLPDPSALGVAASFSTSAGVATLRLLGTASLVDYVAILRTIVYTNGADEPTPAARVARVEVQDGSNPSEPAFVHIATQLVNDHEPVFAPTTYAVSVAEDATIGTVLVTLLATDQDSTVQFSLAPSTDADAFSIDPASGLLRTGRPLDRETQAEYVVGVVASDGEFTDQATVTITVLDVNDNAPSAPRSTYSVLVSENANPMHPVLPLGPEVSDPDAGINGTAGLRFALTGGNGTSFFDIDAVRGLITVTNASGVILDREATPTLVLEVGISDGGVPAQTLQVSVVVTVEDVNDNAPVFVTPGPLTVTENQAAPQTVAQLQATDADEGDNAVIQYALQGTTVFAINANTGTLRATAVLDREQQAQHVLTVTASNPATVTEQATDLTLARPVAASDADAAANSQIEYSLEFSSTLHAIVFQINSATGVVSVVRPDIIDRENAATALFNLTVAATNTEAPFWKTTVPLVVRVLDINDNSPVFDCPACIVVVSENTTVNTVITTMSATDADAGDNANIVYTFSAGHPSFRINALTAEITLVETLDRETQTGYRLQVVAIDLGSPARRSFTDLILVVTDVNDNTPVFGKTSYADAVPENSPSGVEVLRVTARDADAAKNAALTFAIVAGAVPHFELGAQDGVLRTTGVPLDHEAQQQFVLTVAVTDGGSPARSATVPVTVTVLDENDNTPVWAPASVASPIRLAEDRPVGSVIRILQADDRDSAANGQVRYALTGGNVNNRFTVDAATGELRLNNALDRETLAAYTLTVRATDQGAEPRSVSAVLVILVDDVNDNAPSFVGLPAEVVLSEAAAVGFHLVTLQTRDIDAGANAVVTVEITAGNDGGAFAVTSAGQFLTVAAPLDRERQDEYTLTLRVRDQGSPATLESLAQVRIVIGDVNDNAPVFSQPHYAVTRPENIASGSLVLRVVATDADLGANAAVTFALAPLSPHFALNAQTGELTSSVLLDRETQATYNFNVSASDGTFTARATMAITLSDINDSPPQVTGLQPTTFPEETFQLAVAQGLRLADPDVDFQTLMWATATVSILDGSAERLALTASPSSSSAITVATSSSSGEFVLNISQAGTLAEYEGLLQSLVYRNARDEPTPADRRLTVRVFDGLLASVPRSVNISIQLLNDQPRVTQSLLVLNALAEDTPAAANAGTQVAALGASLEDDDADHLPLGVALSSPGNARGVWQFRLDGSAQWQPVTTDASLAQLLRPQDHVRFVPALNYYGLASVQLQAWDRTAGTAGATLPILSNFFLRDTLSAQFATAQVVVSAVNDAPVFEVSSAAGNPFSWATSFAEGSAPVALVDPAGSTLTDVDGQPADAGSDRQTLAQATLTVVAYAGDVVSFDNADVVESATADVSNPAQSDCALFHISVAAAGPRPALLTYTIRALGPDAASVDQFHTCLRAVRFENVAVEMDDAERVFNWTISDGDLTAQAQARVTMILTNDETPEAAAAPLQLFAWEPYAAADKDRLRVQVLASLTVTDLDAGLPLSASVMLASPTTADAGQEYLWLPGMADTNLTLGPMLQDELQVLLRQLEYVNTQEEPHFGVRTVTLELHDGVRASAPVLVSVRVTPVPDQGRLLLVHLQGCKMHTRWQRGKPARHHRRRSPDHEVAHGRQRIGRVCRLCCSRAPGV